MQSPSITRSPSPVSRSPSPPPHSPTEGKTTQVYQKFQDEPQPSYAAALEYASDLTLICCPCFILAVTGWIVFKKEN